MSDSLHASCAVADCLRLAVASRFSVSSNKREDTSARQQHLVSCSRMGRGRIRIARIGGCCDIQFLCLSEENQAVLVSTIAS